MRMNVTTGRTGRRVLAGLAAAVLLTGIGTAAAVPAQAGGSCTLGCSETHNVSSLGVLAGRNWNGQSTGSGQTMWLYNGDKTPQKQDWDAFRVDAGYCYKVRWYFYGIAQDNSTYNQVGKGALWVQVHNYETAEVRSQAYGHCP